MLQHNRFFPRTLCVAAVFLSFSSAAAAAEDADRAADHDSLRKLRATYEDAVNNNDLTKLKPLLADGFTGVMISGEEVKSFEDLQAFWKKAWAMLGTGGRYHVKVITDQTDFAGDVGISRGYTEELFHTSAGKDYAVQARWTAITRKQNGEWKVFRVQGSINPLDNAGIADMVKQARIFFGAIGAVIGLALGMIIRGLWGKRRAPSSVAA
jgi:ketosteroid isomerase-like protein